MFLKYSNLLLQNDMVYPGFDTPEVDKLSSRKIHAQVLGTFVEWLKEKNLEICEWDESTSQEEYHPIRKSTEQLLADFFEIDLEKVDLEKRRILAHIRVQDGGNPDVEHQELGLPPVELVEVKPKELARDRVRKPARQNDSEQVPS